MSIPKYVVIVKNFGKFSAFSKGHILYLIPLEGNWGFNSICLGSYLMVLMVMLMMIMTMMTIMIIILFSCYQRTPNTIITKGGPMSHDDDDDSDNYDDDNADNNDDDDDDVFSKKSFFL